MVSVSELVGDAKNLLLVRQLIILSAMALLIIYGAVVTYFYIKTSDNDQDQHKVQFAHRVWWGANGTDGIILFIGKVFYKFMFLGIFLIFAKMILGKYAAPLGNMVNKVLKSATGY